MKRKIQVKVTVYSVFKVEGITLPTDLKGDLLEKSVFPKISMMLCGLAEYIPFYQDVNIKAALSSLQYNIIEIALVA